MVHQHFMLAEPYTVIENILIGAEPSKGAWNWLPPFLRPLDRARSERSSTRFRVNTVSKSIGMRVSRISRSGIHQRIEIIKLLYRDAGILILDEPTAVLTPQETSELFGHLRKLRAEGKTILIITHKLKEVIELADEATVFRAGQVVGHRKISETDPDDLASLMVGRKVNLTASPPKASQPGKAVLEVRNVTLRAKSRGRIHAPSLSHEKHEARNLLSDLNFEVPRRRNRWNRGCRRQWSVRAASTLVAFPRLPSHREWHDPDLWKTIVW